MILIKMTKSNSLLRLKTLTNKGCLCMLVLLLCGSLTLLAQQKNYPVSITVALDGSGDFKTIQEAVNSVRDLSQQKITIHIKAGIYHEKVVIPATKTKVFLQGDDAGNTVISNADYSGKPIPGGKDESGRDKFSTFNSYTLLVRGNDFTAESLTIENSAGRVGQAVALDVEADRCVIRNCRLLGNQDTLYTGNDTSRQFYQHCWIEGTTDFIFGSATAVFQDCTVKSLANSYITAASTTPRQPYGYVFLNCRLIADAGITKVYLGRPWRPFARVVYIECQMDNHIIPIGWHNWNNPENEKTAFYAEYNSKGDGARTEARVNWSKQLTADEAGKYTIANILSGSDNWKPLQDHGN